MEWLTHITALCIGFIIGIFFVGRNQRKIAKTLREEFKISFEEYKKERDNARIRKKFSI